MNDTIREMFAMLCKPIEGEQADTLSRFATATKEGFFINYSREEKLSALCSLGILTPEEAETYKDAPAELPADKKALIVNYFLLNIYNETAAAYRAPFSELLAGIPKRITPGEAAGAKPLAFLDVYDISKEEALERFAARSINYYYNCAQTFVGAYRKRFRACLMPFMRMEVAAVLSNGEPKEDELNPNPVLWDIVTEAGYRGKAKSLNDTDKAAIDKAAAYFLNVIELGFLNGEMIKAEQRKENAPTSKGVLTESFFYENEYDEALWSFEVIETVYPSFLYEALNGDALLGIKNLLKQMYFGTGLTGEKAEERKEFMEGYTDAIERIRSSAKFKTYVTEAEQC